MHYGDLHMNVRFILFLPASTCRSIPMLQEVISVLALLPTSNDLSPANLIRSKCPYLSEALTPRRSYPHA